MAHWESGEHLPVEAADPATTRRGLVLFALYTAVYAAFVVVSAFRPAWSPDGNKLAFMCGPTYGGVICITDADGQNGDSVFGKTSFVGLGGRSATAADTWKGAFYNRSQVALGAMPLRAAAPPHP